jgi:hypothetical protein
MPTLILSSETLSPERALAGAARRAGWTVYTADTMPTAEPAGPLACYVTTDRALVAAKSV